MFKYMYYIDTCLALMITLLFHFVHISALFCIFITKNHMVKCTFPNFNLLMSVPPFRPSVMMFLCMIQQHRFLGFQSVREMPKVVEKLRSIHQLTLRKHRLKVRQEDVRARVAASKSGILRTPSSKHPRLRPAWNLDRSSGGDLDDPVAAIEFVLSVAHIAMK